MGREQWLLIFIMMIVIVVGATTNLTGIYYNYNIFDADNYTSGSGSKVQFLGERDYGFVVRYGPYGNTQSPVKVAYVAGVHPMEVQAHQAMMTAVTNEQSLKYTYYVYQITVTKDRDDYNKGRIHGQELARDYAVPDIIKEKYDLVVDVHSTRGDYPETRFIAVPSDDSRSLFRAHQIVNKIPWLVFYSPPFDGGPTSGPYVTIPIINSGTPAMVYETYTYASFNETLDHAKEFLRVVDSLSLK
ncbi:hypothetical protein MBMB1_0046 [Methanobacterium sp. MB1]|uniref:hypothetical protein n=1 Tax=Methanobacterium sp. TaxID=2164 RepID=UPI0003C92B91|nr:hypothetical protein [uncultured Methanobacterium sp.]CDG64165.1 hypothetical protein MBMB1_0046 [Methanobacterium sp. MB1]